MSHEYRETPQIKIKGSDRMECRLSYVQTMKNIYDYRIFTGSFLFFFKYARHTYMPRLSE